LGQRDVEAYCTNLLGIIATRQRDPVAALRWDEQTLTVWRELGDRSEEAISEGNLGESWLDLGEPTLARRHLEEGARLARACGNGLVVIDVLCNLSVLKRRLGQGERAVALAQMAIDAAAATGAVDFHATSLQRLGEAELTLGHHAAAASAFERIQALALQGHRSDVPDALGGLASVALARGDVPTALHLVLRVLELDGASAVALRSSNPRALALICHRVLSSAGDPRALAWLQRAHGELLSVAATISDEALRAGFFDNIPEHRAILAAWALHERELQAQAGTSAW
jgi:tetratricopeptide (TPR) repeat protein